MKILRPVSCLLTLLFVSTQMAVAQSLEVYRIYDVQGKERSFEQMIESLATADVVLFGELHDHALIHWLQLKATESLAEKRPLVLGGEMFECDQQVILDEYMKGLLNDKMFEDQARLWPNYKTDYKSLLLFAKEKKLRFVASNVPRRYASLVSRVGLDSLEQLPAASRVFLPRLPIAFDPEAPGYPEMIQMMGGHGHGFNPMHFVQAQALKDACMAEHIIDSRGDNELLLHFNGDYHSANRGGIYWYLKAAEPGLKTQVIKVFSDTDFNFQEEWRDSGDFILVVPEDFTRTH